MQKLLLESKLMDIMRHDEIWLLEFRAGLSFEGGFKFLPLPLNHNIRHVDTGRRFRTRHAIGRAIVLS